MSDTQLIEGSVARVLNTRELVINRGSEHGVTKGMLFEVLDQAGNEIRDPDSGEILGSVYRPKVRVQVTVVEEKLALAETYRTFRRNVGGQGMDFTRVLGQPPKWITVYETFKVEDAAWENISESQSIVKTGDPVRQYVPTDTEEADQPLADG